MSNISSKIHQLEVDNTRRKALGALSMFGLMGTTGLIGCGGGSSSGSSNSNAIGTAASVTGNITDGLAAELEVGIGVDF